MTRLTWPTMGLLQAVQWPLGLVLTPCLLISDCKVPSIESNWSTPLLGPVGDLPTLLGLAYWASAGLAGCVCYKGTKTTETYNKHAKYLQQAAVTREGPRKWLLSRKVTEEKVSLLLHGWNCGKTPIFFILSVS